MRAALFLAVIVASSAAHAADPTPAATAPAPNPAEAGNTTVSFKNPEKFIDANTSNNGTGASPRVLDELKAYLEKLGKDQLPAGQQLQLTITDIDLAGRWDMMRTRPDWVRVMRDVDWPRIELHYKLTQNGQTLRGADARVADMNYLSNGTLQRSTESLRYEKEMLKQWFTKTFAAK
jgi:hypothetical protein